MLFLYLNSQLTTHKSQLFMQLIGAFSKIITLNNLPMKGAINDNLLEIIENAGVLIANGEIIEIDNFEKLVKNMPIKPRQKYIYKRLRPILR